ncbi:MAG TPA: hypothetical protein VGO93_08860 [Candidatus Xenobia bacterium]
MRIARLLLGLTLCLFIPAWSAKGDLYREGVRQYYLGARPGDAVPALQKAVAKDEGDPMAHLMLSRAWWHRQRAGEALAEIAAATGHLARATDEESYLIKAWRAHLQVATHASTDAHLEGDAQDLVATGIALYPNSAELYILAGEMAPTRLQAAPYYLAALAIQPSHPVGQRWKPAVPPVPKVDFTLSSQPTVPSIPVKLYGGLGHVHHRVTTRQAKVQAYFDQGLCLLYGYVNPWARKSFSVAATLDPNCAMAYWGLSFCPPPTGTDLVWAEKALDVARRHATDAEQRYCAIRVLQLQGHDGEALDALGGALLASPRDPELWMYRATFDGFAGESDDRRSLHGIPFALAARRLQPDHLSANHELTHAYEAVDRPMLGWPYSCALRRSAPNLPHAQHMQAHLAMRLGRWEEALQCTRAAARLSALGYPELDRDHHRNVLLWALGHQGCFRAALAVPRSDSVDLSWARLLRLKLDDRALDGWARARRAHPGDGWYLGALADLDRGRWQAAAQKLPHVRAVHAIWYNADTDLWSDEVRGRMLLASGHSASGLGAMRSLARWADGLEESHRWGQGAYYDELWGEAALRTGHLAEAQEAFGEALAHEHGSIVAALGLEVVSEHLHQTDEAASYAARARGIWRQADAGALDRLRQRLQGVAGGRAPIF